MHDTRLAVRADDTVLDLYLLFSIEGFTYRSLDKPTIFGVYRVQKRLVGRNEALRSIAENAIKLVGPTCFVFLHRVVKVPNMGDPLGGREAALALLERFFSLTSLGNVLLHQNHFENLSREVLHRVDERLNPARTTTTGGLCRIVQGWGDRKSVV